MTAPTRGEIVSQEYKYGFHDDFTYLAETEAGLTRATVEEISAIKEEPEWMLQFRLRAYDHFLKRSMPTWVPESVQGIDFSKIVYYRKPSEREEKSWDDVPEQIKQTFEKLGIPEAERKFLAGVGAQYDSEVVYHSVREELSKIGVVFMGMDQGLREYPDLVKKYFATVVPPEDNKFAALNSAVWSGGSFVYVPKGVEVPLPLQAYFRINGENTGQFERTLIIADEGSKVHYIEGCTAPIYTTDALHAAVVEVIALPGAQIRYTTIQNWSRDVYNLVTKRAHAHAHSTVEWVDANTGCLTGDSLVYKNNDLVPIAEIEPGDMVYSLTPEFEVGRSRVDRQAREPAGAGLQRRPAEPSRGAGTANHPFLVARKTGRTRQLAWTSVASIVPGDELAIVGQVPDNGRPHRIRRASLGASTRGISFMEPAESTEDLLWLLGFYVGDGYLDGDEPRHVRGARQRPGVRDRSANGCASVFGVEATPGARRPAAGQLGAVRGLASSRRLRGRRGHEAPARLGLPDPARPEAGIHRGLHRGRRARARRSPQRLDHEHQLGPARAGPRARDLRGDERDEALDVDAAPEAAARNPREELHDELPVLRRRAARLARCTSCRS